MTNYYDEPIDLRGHHFGTGGATAGQGDHDADEADTTSVVVFLDLVDDDGASYGAEGTVNEW